MTTIRPRSPDLRLLWVPRSLPPGRLGLGSLKAATLHTALPEQSAGVMSTLSRLRLHEGPARQIRGEIAQLARGFVLERPQVAVEALARVVARGAGIDQKCPVGALQREQLAQGTLGGRSGELGAALEPRKLAAAPGAQVAALPPARRRHLGPGQLGLGGRRRQLHARRLGMLDHRAQPRDALVPVVAEQLRVERDDGVLAQRGQELAGVGSGLLAPAI